MNKEYSTVKKIVNKTDLFLDKKKFETSIAFGGLRFKGSWKETDSGLPLISVITVVFNGEKFIEDTIKSVLEQSYENIEYIIIDGGSTDKTLDIINKYEDYIDFWVSEKDGGIYDAMNKGIINCKGDLISILNADDYFYSSNVLELAASLYSEEKFIAGNCAFETDFGTNLFCVDEERNPAINIPFIHTATLIPASIYKAVGLYDTKYRIASDIEMFFRIKKYGFSFVNLKTNIVLMRDGGASHKQFKLGRAEYKDIYLNYNPNCFIKAYYYYTYSLLEFYAYNNRFIRKGIRYIKRAFNC